MSEFEIFNSPFKELQQSLQFIYLKIIPYLFLEPQRSGRKRSTASKSRPMYRPDTGRSTITSIGYDSSFIGGVASDYSDDFDDSTSSTSTADEGRRYIIKCLIRWSSRTLTNLSNILAYHFLPAINIKEYLYRL